MRLLPISLALISSLFLLILTVIGITLGIYSLFLEEPELNGIFFSKTTKQLATEAIIWCVWILGFGISFIVNIFILYRNIRLTVNRKDTARPQRKLSPGQCELADSILKLLREYHRSVEDVHRQDREYGRPQTDVPPLKLTAVTDRVGSPKGTVSKLLSHASAYSHELAMLWEMYGPLQRRSKASTKKGRFEQVNDAVGYDRWDDEEEDREL